MHESLYTNIHTHQSNLLNSSFQIQIRQSNILKETFPGIHAQLNELFFINITSVNSNAVKRITASREHCIVLLLSLLIVSVDIFGTLLTVVGNIRLPFCYR